MWFVELLEMHWSRIKVANPSENLSSDQKPEKLLTQYGRVVFEDFPPLFLTLITGIEVVNESRYVGDALIRRECSKCFWSIESFWQELGTITSGCRQLSQCWVSVESGWCPFTLSFFLTFSFLLLFNWRHRLYVSSPRVCIKNKLRHETEMV